MAAKKTDAQSAIKGRTETEQRAFPSLEGRNGGIR